jgi:ketosteroid isomerase-like protein
MQEQQTHPGCLLPCFPMKSKLFALLALSVASLAPLHAADTKPPTPENVASTSNVITAVTAADAERLAAVQAGNRDRLNAIYSDDLRYAHSSGKIDTKASYVESLVSKATRYESYDYKERNFTVIAPGVVLMTGRVVAKIVQGGKPSDLDLNFLGVWRDENGHWKFVAWQSCKNTPPAPAAK